MLALMIQRWNESCDALEPIGYVGPDATRSDRPHPIAPDEAARLVDRIRRDAPGVVMAAVPWRDAGGVRV